ncbi:hypothetical protein CYLTODRAFT_446378 [Cylindrobasidium torrendii FP15055 ss-10]|uniref:Transmembrane protein n=1 Tax=Cylindrobasidium torrendii FP15055 ss-10 TaxID=1314674 RepID=A0A0D7B2R7_9AGAR|nr:hypothetical protein CYLTODRAFT_446378 [Cylindrobasidium torrendii FP15055 ss-10]
MADEAAFSRTFRRGYFDGLAIECLSHGVYTAIFAVAAYKIVSKKAKTSSIIFPIVLAFMYTCASIHVGIRWWWVENAFIDHGATSDTIIASFLDIESAQWFIVLSGLSASFLILSADIILIWRCWVIWFRSVRVVTIPITGFLLGCVFDGLFLWQDFTHDTDTDRLNWGLHAVNWGTAFFACSLATTLVCTGLIMWRLARMQVLQTYSGVVEVLVESAAMYALALIVFMAFLVRDDPGNVYAQPLLISAAGIAPTLIVARNSLKGGEALVEQENACVLSVTTSEDTRTTPTSFSFPTLNVFSVLGKPSEDKRREKQARRSISSSIV